MLDFPPKDRWLNLGTENEKSIRVRYAWIEQTEGRCDAFCFKKRYLAPRKGLRSAIKLIGLYGTTWPFSAVELLDFCKTRRN